MSSENRIDKVVDEVVGSKYVQKLSRLIWVLIKIGIVLFVIFMAFVLFY